MYSTVSILNLNFIHLNNASAMYSTVSILNGVKDIEEPCTVCHSMLHKRRKLSMLPWESCDSWHFIKRIQNDIALFVLGHHELRHLQITCFYTLLLQVQQFHCDPFNANSCCSVLVNLPYESNNALFITNACSDESYTFTRVIYFSKERIPEQ